MTADVLQTFKVRCERSRSQRKNVVSSPFLEVRKCVANFSRCYVTLWPWPLTPWPRTFVVDRVSRGHILYQIWVNAWLSYWSFSIFLHIFTPTPHGVKIREGYAKCLSQDFKFPVSHNLWYIFGEGPLHMLEELTHFPASLGKGQASSQSWGTNRGHWI